MFDLLVGTRGLDVLICFQYENANTETYTFKCADSIRDSLRNTCLSDGLYQYLLAGCDLCDAINTSCRLRRTQLPIVQITATDLPRCSNRQIRARFAMFHGSF